VPQRKRRHLRLKQTSASVDDQGLWFPDSQPDTQGPGRAFTCARTLAWGERGSNAEEFRAAADHQLEAAAETSDNSPGYRALSCLNPSLARAIACHPPKANPLFSDFASITSSPPPCERKLPLILISEVLFMMLQMCYLQLTVLATYFSLKDTA